MIWYWVGAVVLGIVLCYLAEAVVMVRARRRVLKRLARIR